VALLECAHSAVVPACQIWCLTHSSTRPCAPLLMVSLLQVPETEVESQQPTQQQQQQERQQCTWCLLLTDSNSMSASILATQQ